MPMGSSGRSLSRWSWRLTVLALALVLGVRWVRYLPVSWSPGFDHLLGGLMIYEAQLCLWPLVLTLMSSKLLVGAGVLAAAVLRRRLVHRVGDVVCCTPLMMSLCGGAVLWGHYLFDVSPFVASMCALCLPLAWVRPAIAAPRASRALAAVSVVIILVWLWSARDFADRVAVVFWALVLFATDRWGSRALGDQERRLLLLLAVIPANLIPATLPLALPWHGGTRFGDGLAYHFCELPSRRTLLATVPGCDSVHNDFSSCGHGQVVAYDSGTLERTAAYRFFSPSYYGRLEQIVCVEDDVYVGVQSTWYRGRMADQTALSFTVGAPERFRPFLAGKGIGNTIAYDASHDALFFTGELSHRIVRYDRRTGAFDERVGEPLRRRWFHPISGQALTGSFLMPSTAVDPGRDRVYPVEWMQGRYAYAVDTSTLRPVARYAVQSGGGLAATVDPERGRLVVTGIWGMEVFDLASGALIARRRLGFFNHSATLDAARNRLYLPSAVEGKIRVLDRDTFAVIGQVPIGMGPRYLHLSADGTRLFGSSSSAHYYWDADALPPARSP